jgi:lipopolysaccharide/colanic/teichoic acid biosynthesis glycosyltransferase
MIEPLKHQHIPLLIKRVFDLVVAVILLLALSPLALIIALAIRLTSGKPILYEWRVAGQGGRPFVGHKFRTMIPNADQLKSELMERNEMNSGPVFKIKDDPRITPIGKILRKYSLDELPQLWCVLKGKMSIVGPRPPLLSEYAQFEEWQKRKLVMRPGMTCLWQVRGKPTDWHAWLRLDFEYIDHWSLWLDFKILWQTFIVVITGKNF